jgi:hypothetical protein
MVRETADLKVAVSRTLEAIHMMRSTSEFKFGKGSHTRGENSQSTLLAQSCRYLRSSEMKMTLPSGTVNGIGQLGTNIPNKRRQST